MENTARVFVRSNEHFETGLVNCAQATVKLYACVCVCFLFFLINKSALVNL